MDELEYDFIEMELPNIVGKWPKNREKKTLKVLSPLSQFIKTLAIKYPQRRFVSSHFYRYEDYAEAYRFRVYEGKEFLGELSLESGSSSRGGTVFVIGNDRIKKARERGSESKTKDLNKAVRIFEKNFNTQTVAEKLVEASSETNDVVNRVFHDRERKHQDNFRGVIRHLEKYIVDNWETLSEIAIKNNADVKEVQSLQANYAEYEAVKEIYECKSKNNGSVVLLHGADYTVKRVQNGEEKVMSYSGESLPAHIKVSVGMLKLLEPKKFVGGVGVRVSESIFYVTKEAV